MKEGEGNESSVACVGLAGALEGALDASLGDTLDAAEALRFEKNFSSRSRPFAIANVWARRMVQRLGLCYLSRAVGEWSTVESAPTTLAFQ